jgi:hypothetical protein
MFYAGAQPALFFNLTGNIFNLAAMRLSVDFIDHT